MRTTRTVMVEKEITTYKCDFCEYQIENNTGCCGQRSIMECGICGKDACRQHRESFYEHDQDYPDITVCNACLPNFRIAWEEAKILAGRYEDIGDVSKRIFKEMQEIGLQQWLTDHGYDEEDINEYSNKSKTQINIRELYE